MHLVVGAGVHIMSKQATDVIPTYRDLSTNDGYNILQKYLTEFSNTSLV